MLTGGGESLLSMISLLILVYADVESTSSVDVGTLAAGEIARHVAATQLNH